jgi:heptosyltransferase-2
VIVRPPNWLGDAVLALPALGAIRAAYPNAELTIAAPSTVAALFRERTDVRPDRILELPEGRRAAIAALTRANADLGILFPNSFGSAWMMRRAGVAERWGVSSAGRGWLLTRRSRRPARGGDRHQAAFYRALVEGLDIACDARDPWLAPSDESAAAAASLLERAGVDLSAPLVGLAPGAAYGQAKQWPPARVAELAARLAREAGATSVVVGAPHDRDTARAIESWLRAEAPDALTKIVDLVGRTSVGALAGVAARTRVFVANDSGAMHLAAAAGRPVVAIFGPTDERVTGPRGDHEVITAAAFCRPCLMRDCPIDHRCMTRIPVDRVFASVAARLAATGPV